MSTLRSLMLGDVDHYRSPYMRGVAQAAQLLGHAHVQVSIRQPAQVIARAVAAHKPHIVWTHMVLWPPPPARVDQLVGILEGAARAGARVVLHDGDYKERCRYPRDISSWCALALVNHAHDRSPWRVPTLWWPYFAMAQDRIAEPDPRWRCGLWFAGAVGRDATYAGRTALLEALRTRGVGLRVPTAADGNTIDSTPVIAASADAVLGFGRPGVRGWVDTRATQYPGAGGILVHDDVGGLLEPWVHYAPYRSGDAASVVEALERLRAMTETERRQMLERAFSFVQREHSSVARVRQVISAVGLA